MNVIELSMFITPIAGAVGGASAVKTHSSFSVIGSIVLGLLVGIGLIVGSRRLVRVIPERWNRPDKRYDGLMVLICVFLIPLAFPVVSFGLSKLIVAGLLQL
jgi:hypothetical protein